ncbi:helix-hairpin-helix domain-containing protein [bacterium]|nr:helix-hairpin-helix domain-containing protein [candidate division CSSED10-310 bacterium]
MRFELFFRLIVSLILVISAGYRFRTGVLLPPLAPDPGGIQQVLDTMPVPSGSDPDAQATRNAPRPEIILSGKGASGRFAVELFRVFPWGIDLNRVSPEGLVMIRGIGPHTAESICLEREARGRFSDLEDFFRRTRVSRRVVEGTGGWVYVGE